MPSTATTVAALLLRDSYYSNRGSTGTTPSRLNEATTSPHIDPITCEDLGHTDIPVIKTWSPVAAMEGDRPRRNTGGSSTHGNEITTPPDTDYPASPAQKDSDSVMPKHNHSHHTGPNHPPLDHDDGVTEPPPPYESAAAPSTLTQGEKGPTRVAMLPFGAPSAGFVYLYRRIDVLKHDHLLIRGSGGPTAMPVRIYRNMKCCVNEASATQKETGTKPGKTTTIGPFYDLGPNEIERVSGQRYDWTRDWDFTLFVRNYSKDGLKWMADGCLYFKGLSPADYDAIPWNNPLKTMRVEADALPSKHERKNLQLEWRKFTWKFCERSDSPRWGASFTVYHQEGSVLPTFDNPWFFFDSVWTDQ